MTTTRMLITVALGVALATTASLSAEACTGAGGGRGASVSAGGDPFQGAGSADGSRSRAPKATVHTQLKWRGVELREMPAVTGVGQRWDEKAQAEAERRHLRRQLGIRSANPPGATLVVFHYFHGEGLHGKAQDKLCHCLHDETVARWGRLMHCVEVFVPESSRKLVEQLGGGTKPMVAVLDAELNVVARLENVRSARKTWKFLRATLQEKLPEYWAEIESRLDEQQVELQRAKRLVKEKDLEEANRVLRGIYFSDLRVGEWWDDAAALLIRVHERIERA